MRKLLTVLIISFILIQPSPTFALTYCKLQTAQSGGTNVNGFGDSAFDQVVASAFTPASNCVVSSIGLYVSQNAARADDAYAAILADSAGTPAATLEVCATFHTTTSFAWGTSTCSGATTLNAGTQYWIAASSTTGSTGSTVFLASMGGTASPQSQRRRTGVWQASNNPTMDIAYTILAGTAASPIFFDTGAMWFNMKW